MKKLKVAAVVFVIIISVVSVLFVCGKQILIKNLAKNGTINDMIEKIEMVISDEKSKQQINDFVQQLVDEGVLNEQQIEDYIKVVENEPTLSLNINGKTIGEATQNNDNREVTEPTPQPTEDTTTTKSKTQSKTERVLNAMTPAEASFTMSVYSRISVSEVMKLMETDKAAAKQYVTERLSADEISQALALYSKYSYLLKE